MGSEETVLGKQQHGKKRDCVCDTGSKEGPQLARTGASQGFPRAAAPVGVFSRGTTCSFPGENARSWEALGEARPGQSSLSAGALR